VSKELEVERSLFGLPCQDSTAREREEIVALDSFTNRECLYQTGMIVKVYSRKISKSEVAVVSCIQLMGRPWLCKH